MELKDYLHMEEWRHISGFGCEYAVSNMGRIRGGRKVTYGSKSSSGYYRACLWNGEKFVFVMVHRLVATAFIGNASQSKEVNHKNGNKLDNRVENLEWVTRSENSIHAYKNNLRSAHPVIGARHYRAKLSEDQVKEIRKSSLSQVKLAAQYSISKSVIQKIKENRIWKHVQ